MKAIVTTARNIGESTSPFQVHAKKTSMGLKTEDGYFSAGTRKWDDMTNNLITDTTLMDALSAIEDGDSVVLLVADKAYRDKKSGEWRNLNNQILGVLVDSFERNICTLSPQQLEGVKLHLSRGLSIVENKLKAE